VISIKGIALDVDGVLTDGAFWWGPEGGEWKRFSYADVMGISLARRAGLLVALISGEESPLIDRYAEKLGISEVVKNCKDKAAALTQIADRQGLNPKAFCFMGDDINDLSAMRLAGLSAAPADARQVVLNEARFVSRLVGGNGAVRDVIDAILAAQADSYGAL
jgi:3-deoxy-D-manno-octulosonate 8-phosphate phosphatase (KDO 8-P phosphatase)